MVRLQVLNALDSQLVFRACEGDGKGDFRKNQAANSYTLGVSYAESLSIFSRKCVKLILRTAAEPNNGLAVVG